MTIAKRHSSKSNIIYAPASNNDDQTNAANAEVRGNLVAYDLMMSHSRSHSDGGLIIPPSYDISGFVWEDFDYDGLYNFADEIRVVKKNGKNEIEMHREQGYANKKVILTAWYYDPADSTWKKAGQYLTGENKDVRNDMTGGTMDTLTGGATTTTKKKVQLTDEHLKAAGYDDFTQFEGAYAEGTGAGTKWYLDIDGYYEFTDLPTAYHHANGQWYLAGYTLEVSGANDDTGLASTLVTTHQWKTTDQDAWNSKSQPLFNAEDVAALAAATNVREDSPRYRFGNYPVFWAEDDVQSGSAAYVGAGSKSGVAKNVASGKTDASEVLFGGRIVLAGIADTDSVDKQHQALTVSNTVTENGIGSVVDTTVDFDFARGQDQTAMNAGFAPPDRSSLAGVVWYDENYDGIRDNFNDVVDELNPDKPIEDTEAGLEDMTVVLTQYYFVPKYDESHTHQLVEDEDGNMFYYADAAKTKLVLYKASATANNVLAATNGDVYYVRNGRLYPYETTSRFQNLKDSGTWVENEAFVGSGEYLVKTPEVKSADGKVVDAGKVVFVKPDDVKSIAPDATSGAEMATCVIDGPRWCARCCPVPTSAPRSPTRRAPTTSASCRPTCWWTMRRPSPPSRTSTTSTSPRWC